MYREKEQEKVVLQVSNKKTMEIHQLEGAERDSKSILELPGQIINLRKEIMIIQVEWELNLIAMLLEDLEKDKLQMELGNSLMMS